MNEPMQKALEILDINTVGKRTDEEVRDFLSCNFPQLPISNLTNVERYQQEQVILMAIEYGAGLRQIVRITGIPYGIVRQIK